MALHYVKKNEIPHNTKVIILRPDIEFRNGLDLPSIFSNELKTPYFLYNKIGEGKPYQATDCVWLCLAGHLESVYNYLLDPTIGLIDLPQKYFLPCPNGNYNETWALYR